MSEVVGTIQAIFAQGRHAQIRHVTLYRDRARNTE